MGTSHPLFILLASLLLLLFSLCDSYPLGKEYRKSMAFWVNSLVLLNPPYTWGDFDCSKTLYKAAELSGIPVHRDTAFHMSQGKSNWVHITLYPQGLSAPGIENPWKSITPERGDLCWWTLKETRPFGHVGCYYKKDTIGHASSSRGFTSDPTSSKFGKSVVKIGRLTWKDKRYEKK